MAGKCYTTKLWNAVTRSETTFLSLLDPESCVVRIMEKRKENTGMKMAPQNYTDARSQQKSLGNDQHIV
ncbi:hypothetical protein B7P43_G13814 [Cryptotermes secundus]|uniref:Uncharacterized protein n=1 Tax=Cryptotermes secundus TaxID=105785 RepID=A0A2J7R9P5_9NEOP|nr:hypothetical protein B7P43_G13814 [Cryptotermes secundus]